MDRISWRLAPGRWLAAFTLAIPGLYLALLPPFAHRVGTADYDQFRVFHELQYWNANLFGLAKQWSPLMCAGLSIAGEPQVPFASLTMLLSYGLGPSLGILAGIGCYLILGAIGAYRDLRKLLVKEVVVAETTSWVFRATPFVLASVMLTVAAVVPLLDARPALGFAGNIVL